MSEVKSISSPQIDQLLTWLTGLPWPIDKAMVKALTCELGWSVESDESGIGFVTGYPIHKPYASVSIPDGSVSDVLVAVATSGSPTPALRDLFADHVDLVTGRQGDPVRREPGKSAAAQWLLENGSEFRIGLTTTSIMWSVTSPEFVQIEADLGRR